MMGSRYLLILSVILLSASFSACAGTYKHTIDLDPAEPLRVAVLPFAQVNAKGELIMEDGSLLLDNVPLVSSKSEDSPTQYVQSLVQSSLERSGLDVVSPTFVERKLSHSSLAKGLSADLAKLRAANPKELCELLVCDALMYGTITDWDRAYYGLQSVNSVGIELKLVSAGSGKTLFSASAKDSDSRGISKGPTGFSSLVIEPVRGLDNEIILKLASEMVPKMLQPLYVKNRPEYLNTPPPSIYASAHDSNGRDISQQRPLTVLIFGSAGKSASFSIGKAIENIPMEERDRGHYIGEFYPLPSDSFSNEYVEVSLSDENGRVSKQSIGRVPLSFP